jgi:hypothetical protein
MTSYSIQPSGGGWFEVVISNGNGASAVKAGFVNERAAQRWIANQLKVGGPFPPPLKRRPD